MPEGASPEETFTTVVAFIAISTLLTGIALLGLGYFERLALEPGQYLMKQGDKPDNLYIVETGQLTAQA